MKSNSHKNKPKKSMNQKNIITIIHKIYRNIKKKNILFINFIFNT